MKNDKIKKLRELHNLKQEYVAEQLGISQSNYSRLENGIIRLDVDRILRLAELFKVEPYFLFQCNISIEGLCSSVSQCHPQLNEQHNALANHICQRRRADQG